MSLHEVPAHARRGADGALKVHGGGLDEGAKVCAAEGLGGDADGELGGGEGGDGQACAWIWENG